MVWAVASSKEDEVAETKVGVCLGCGRPLPSDRFAPNPHRLYHDETCRNLHERDLVTFAERNPELPGWGRSSIARPGFGDRLRIVRASEGRLAVRFEKVPTKKAVRACHDTDTLPVTYYLADGASAADATTFLGQSYPAAEVVL